MIVAADIQASRPMCCDRSVKVATQRTIRDRLWSVLDSKRSDCFAFPAFATLFQVAQHSNYCIERYTVVAGSSILQLCSSGIVHKMP